MQGLLPHTPQSPSCTSLLQSKKVAGLHVLRIRIAAISESPKGIRNETPSETPSETQAHLVFWCGGADDDPAGLATDDRFAGGGGDEDLRGFRPCTRPSLLGGDSFSFPTRTNRCRIDPVFM